MSDQLVERYFRADGEGVLDETLTPTPGLDWRIFSIKLHVVANPIATEDFVVQAKDSGQGRYNIVLLKQNMTGIADVVQSYEDDGMTLKSGQTVDFDWANIDGNGWGLTVVYTEG